MMLKREHIERSESLRIVQPNNLPTAKAALAFAESIERGTAAIDCRGSAIGTGIVKAGAAVKYRALAGEVYDAKIVFVRADGCVDLDVFTPGGANPLRLTRIVLNDGNRYGR